MRYRYGRGVLAGWLGCVLHWPGSALAVAPTLPDAPGNTWAVDGAVNAIAVDGDRVYLGGTFTHVGPVVRGGSADMMLLDAATGQSTWHINGLSNAQLVIPDEAGGWYVGGGDYTTGWVAHVLSSRIVDPGFSVSLPHFPSVLLLYSGKLYIGGNSPYYLKAVNPVTGVTDAQWHPTLVATDDRYGYEAKFYAMAAGAGQIYIGGFFQSVNGSPRVCLAAVDATTGATTSWNPNPRGSDGVDVISAEVYALAVANGKVYVGGEFWYLGGVLHKYLGAVDATTGAVDPTWNPVTDYKVSGLVVSGDKVYARGGFSSMGGMPRNSAAAVDATTGALASWNPNVVGTPTGHAVSGNDVYIIGEFSSVGGAARRGVALVDATNGIANPSWHPDPYPRPRSVAVSGTNVCIVGGFAMLEQQGAIARTNLVVLSASTGVPDPAWNPGANGAVNALAVSGGKVYVGGSFAKVGGVARSYLAAVDATNGVVDPTWNPGASNSVNALAVSGGKVYVGGSFTKVGGVARSYLAAVDATNGVVDPTWNPGPSNQVNALLVSGGKVYVGGSFTKVGGLPRQYLAAVDALTGGLDAVWLPVVTNENLAAAGAVKALAVHDGKVYVGGYFTKVGGMSRNWLAAVDATNGTVAPWDAGIRDGQWSPGGPYTYFSGTEVRSLAVIGEKVFAGGSFTNVAGVTCRGLVAVDASTGEVDSWRPANLYAHPAEFNYAYPNALAASSNGLFVGHAAGVAQYGPVAEILLSIHAQNGLPVLEWSGAWKDVYVDCCPTLAGDSWQPASGPLSVSVGEWIVTPAVSNQAFFRITQP